MTKPNRWAVARVSRATPPTTTARYTMTDGRWVSLVKLFDGQYVTSDYKVARSRRSSMQSVHGIAGENEYYTVEFYFEEES